MFQTDPRGDGHRETGGTSPAHAAEGESPFAEISHPKKRAFLTAYGQTGNKSLAAKMAGIVKQTIYTRQWRGDPEFQEALKRARVMAADVLEAEAHRRAVEGWEEPVGWYKGQPGGVIRRFSDTLLIFTLKGLLPDRYRERVDVRGSFAHLDLNQLPDELLARIAAGEDIRSVLANVAVAALGSGAVKDGEIVVEPNAAGAEGREDE